MIELIAYVILSALGGYGLGRTIASESIFEGWVQKVIDFCYYPVPLGGVIDPNGSVYQVGEDGTVEVLSQDGYRTDVWRPVALTLGKIGDLLSCETCLSTQLAFQIFLWGSLFGLLTLELIALPAVIGLTYIVLSKLG